MKWTQVSNTEMVIEVSLLSRMSKEEAGTCPLCGDKDTANRVSNPNYPPCGKEICGGDMVAQHFICNICGTRLTVLND